MSVKNRAMPMNKMAVLRMNEAMQLPAFSQHKREKDEQSQLEGYHHVLHDQEVALPRYEPLVS